MTSRFPHRRDQADGEPGRSTRGGLPLFALFMAGLGAMSLVFHVNLPGLQPAPETGGLATLGPWLSGGLVLLSALGLILERTRRISGWALTAVWGFWVLAGHLPRVAGALDDAAAWVALFQGLVFAATSLALINGAAIEHARRILVGFMLILFGGVQLPYPDAIAGLLPEGFPVRTVWPWVTGPIQILAGFAMVANRATLPATAVIAGMFLSWIPIVHAPRVISDPASAFEWTFMLTAGALAAAVWLAREPGERHGREAPDPWRSGTE